MALRLLSFLGAPGGLRDLVLGVDAGARDGRGNSGALVGWMSSGALLGRGRPQEAPDWLEPHLGSMLAMTERKGY